MQYKTAYVAVRMRVLASWDVSTAVLIFTRYSTIFFLSHLDLGSKAFLYMFVGSATCPVLLPAAGRSIVGSSIASKSKWGRMDAINFWAAKRLLKMTSKTIVRNGSMPTDNSRAKLSMAKCTELRADPANNGIS